MKNLTVPLPKILEDKLLNGKNRLPLGQVLIQMQRQFPPFNFYADKPEGMIANDYLFVRRPVPFHYYFEYGQVNRWFLVVIKQAQQDYLHGNVERAVWVYETLMREEYPNYKPYDLLIRHYKKVGDTGNLRRVLDRSISFFTQLRENQRQYVLSLARDVGMEHKAQECIDASKKIHYYGGAFVLYDPVKVMAEWEKLKLYNL